MSFHDLVVGMFDSDSILEKIDSFGRRIGILNRFFWSKNRYFEWILLVKESVFWIDSSKELVSVFWIDSFGRRIGILNRFFERIGIGILNRFFWSKNRYFESILRKNRYFESILWSKNRYFEPILYRQNRNRNGRAIQRLEFWDWWLFFFRNPLFAKNRMKMLLEIRGNFSNNFYNGFFKKRIRILLDFVT